MLPVLLVSLMACKEEAEKAPAGKDAPKDPVATKDPVTKDPDKDKPPVDDPDSDRVPDDTAPPELAKACPGFTAYKSGSAKVEVSGAETGSFEFPDLVISQSGGTTMLEGIVLGYRSASGNERLDFQIPCSTGTATGSTTLNISSAFVGPCTADVKKSDEAGVEGTITCTDLTAFGDNTKQIKFSGTFTAKR